MEADFSGWATKAGLKCSDGRTIMPDAFKHQDTMQVPLVWQHGHSNPENVLGHAILENREDGVYCYGFFNGTKQASHAKELLQHKDISQMSIWANELIERGKRVFHGAIREVSLVLSGANPGALIENVTIRHSDDEETTLDDEAIIFTGMTLEHSNGVKVPDLNNIDEDEDDEDLSHAGTDAGSSSDSGLTVQDVIDSMTPVQLDVMHFMIGEALAEDDAEDAAGTEPGDAAKHGNVGDDSDDDTDDTKKGSNEMKHNVFESDTDKDAGKPVLSHADMKGILADAARSGSLKDAVESYALSHGIEDIDVMFPEATALQSDPSFLSRRTEWVAAFLGAVQKSPFSRIKTLQADITFDDARARGYVTGNVKKEEFFQVSKRVTTPTTVYKKQALDRDDVVDITDFDVVAWLKGEMRLMLDEEVARAALIGDGRDISSDDKINEQNIRPIAKEHELFVTTLMINLQDASSNADEITDAVIANRWHYKGTGTPTLFASETIVSSFLLLKDSLGRRIYNSLDEVAAVLRVSSIVPVEAMEEDPSLVAIIVNPVDYVIGATAGGAVSMFDMFDIDYNKQKYLIETRCSGALTKLKSAIVIRQTASGSDTLVSPNAPTFNASTGVVTIVATSHITYKDQDGNTLSTGAQTALDQGTTLVVDAVPASGYYLDSTDENHWTFTREAPDAPTAQ